MPTTITADSTPTVTVTLDDILVSVDAYSRQTEETDESIGAFADSMVSRYRQERP